MEKRILEKDMTLLLRFCANDVKDISKSEIHSCPLCHFTVAAGLLAVLGVVSIAPIIDEIFGTTVLALTFQLLHLIIFGFGWILCCRKDNPSTDPSIPTISDMLVTLHVYMTPLTTLSIRRVYGDSLGFTENRSALLEILVSELKDDSLIPMSCSTLIVACATYLSLIHI